MDVKNINVRRSVATHERFPPAVALDPINSLARLALTMTVVVWLDLHQQPGM